VPPGELSKKLMGSPAVRMENGGFVDGCMGLPVGLVVRVSVVLISIWRTRGGANARLKLVELGP